LEIDRDKKGRGIIEIKFEKMDFKKVELKTYPSLTDRTTSESRYWRKFKVRTFSLFYFESKFQRDWFNELYFYFKKFPILVKEFAAVTSIDFCKTEPHDFAVTSSTRVQIYSPHTHTVKKTISRFKDIAYSATFRDDGKLLLAGGENGLIQVIFIFLIFFFQFESSTFL